MKTFVVTFSDKRQFLCGETTLPAVEKHLSEATDVVGIHIFSLIELILWINFFGRFPSVKRIHIDINL